jgi:hypothetical protein
MITSPIMALPPVGLLRRYLLARGWQQRQVRSDALDLFVLHEANSDAIELVVPRHGEIAGATARVGMALETLAQIEDRPVERIASAIRGVGFDIIRERLSDAAVHRDSILLSVAEKMIRRTRAFLRASASAEFQLGGRTESPEAMSDAFVKECRFAHTFKGSFGFTIQSPIGSPPQGDLDGGQAPVPSSRLVVQRIMRGLQTFDAQADQGVGLMPDARVGFTAEMFDGLAEILENSKASTVSFGFELSPEWTPDEDLSPETTVQIETKKAGIARELAQTLRSSHAVTSDFVEGIITKLSATENPADLINPKGTREISVRWLTGSLALNVRVPLSPGDYLLALRAHESGKPVKIYGRLEHSGRGYLLREGAIAS